MKKYFFLFVLNLFVINLIGHKILPDFSFDTFIISAASVFVAAILSDLILRIFNQKPPKK